ncbi:MAG: hypothetical protein OEW95_11940 [Candidatus Bathyarchaeota archaeon]|nr:hypothetical protein [Candidatus Bathyarchaeota archaeon]
MEEEIEIIVQPIKKIVIFECTQLPNEEFFKRVELMAMSGQPLVLNWAEGIVFLPLPFQPESDIIIEQAMKGIVYWAVVMFSSMPKYQLIKKFGAREVPIIDQTSIPYLRQVAQWLKKRIKD